MANYSTNIPALNPLAFGINDNPAAGIVQGEPLQDVHVAAATLQHQTRKRFAKSNPQFVTEEELVASKRRKHVVASANFDGPTPIWAQQLQQTLQDQTLQMQEMKEYMQEMKEEFQREMKQEIQRNMNRSRKYTTESIEALIRVDDGEVPGPQAPNGLWFPGNQDELMAASALRINALLGFYGLPANGLQAAKKDRLKRFLGVTL